MKIFVFDENQKTLICKNTKICNFDYNTKFFISLRNPIIDDMLHYGRISTLFTTHLETWTLNQFEPGRSLAIQMWIAKRLEMELPFGTLKLNKVKINVFDCFFYRCFDCVFWQIPLTAAFRGEPDCCENEGFYTYSDTNIKITCADN